MDNTGTWLFLLIAAGVGYALYTAARELTVGIRSGMQDYRARTDHADQTEQAEFADSAEQSHSQGKQSGNSDSGENSHGASRRGSDGPAPRPWHEVLQVHPFASREDIQKAYRRAIALYHPDRVAGLGPELQALAEQRAKEINRAYEVACGLFDRERSRP